MIEITINNRRHNLDVEADTPLLWVIRDTLGLTGTKYGCGVGECGACTVHMNGEAVRSCTMEVSDAEGANVTTIEGLSEDSSHPVQQAWLELDVPQCGYCQSGQIMAAAALLKETPNPSDGDIEDAMTNICRCGTYNGIRTGIKTAAKIIAANKGS